MIPAGPLVTAVRNVGKRSLSLERDSPASRTGLGIVHVASVLGTSTTYLT